MANRKKALGAAKLRRRHTHIDSCGVKGAVSVSRPLVQRYQRIQQSWMAVGNEPAATVGHSK